MVLKTQPTLSNDTLARTRADMLLLLGSYAAAEALAHSAIGHKRHAALHADHELMEHWDAVADIFEEAKRKLGDLK